LTDPNTDISKQNHTYSLIAIGGSAGAIPAVIDWIKFNQGPSIVLVIHRSKENKSNLIALIQHYTTFTVKEPLAGEKLQSKHVYIGPPGYHLVLDEKQCWHLLDTEPVWHCKPAIDVLFLSIAANFAKETAGILLSGANEDGGIGMKKMKDEGCLTLCVNPEKAEYVNMPNSAKKHTAVVRYFDPEEIQELCELYFPS